MLRSFANSYDQNLLKQKKHIEAAADSAATDFVLSDSATSDKHSVLPDSLLPETETSLCVRCGSHHDDNDD
jgi:hypothetical protein